jgi:hypothetical protein
MCKGGSGEFEESIRVWSACKKAKKDRRVPEVVALSTRAVLVTVA